MHVSVESIAKMMGVELADLTTVDDPQGRVDYLVSRIVDQAVSQMNEPEVVLTYRAAKPLIDGLLVKHLGAVRVKIPGHIADLMKGGQER